MESLLIYLENCTEEELSSLQKVLSNPHGIETLRHLVASILERQKAEKRLRMFSGRPGMPAIHKKKSAEKQRRSDQIRRAGKISATTIKNTNTNAEDILRAMLLDKHRFPTMRNAIDEINQSFGTAFPYGKYNRRGRRDLILAALMKHIAGLSEEERKRVLSDFLKRNIADNRQMEEYSELFRILADGK